jgi:hypothetical protein
MAFGNAIALEVCGGKKIPLQFSYASIGTRHVRSQRSSFDFLTHLEFSSHSFANLKNSLQTLQGIWKFFLSAVAIFQCKKTSF